MYKYSKYPPSSATSVTGHYLTGWMTGQPYGSSLNNHPLRLCIFSVMSRFKKLLWNCCSMSNIINPFLYSMYEYGPPIISFNSWRYFGCKRSGLQQQKLCFANSGWQLCKTGQRQGAREPGRENLERVQVDLIHTLLLLPFILVSVTILACSMQLRATQSTLWSEWAHGTFWAVSENT